MEVAVRTYSKKGSKMINRCRIYLQIISVYDLLIYSTNKIHPAYKEREIPLSRSSKICRPAIPKPPKHYWQLWNSFINLHIEPNLLSTPPNGTLRITLGISPHIFNIISPHTYIN